MFLQNNLKMEWTLKWTLYHHFFKREKSDSSADGQEDRFWISYTMVLHLEVLQGAHQIELGHIADILRTLNLQIPRFRI